MANSTFGDGDSRGDSPGVDSLGSGASGKNVSGDVLDGDVLDGDVLDGGALDHSAIKDQSLLERYHLGTLSRREEARFEAHFMDCSTCQEDLEIQRSLLRGMKTVAGEEAARFVVGVQLQSWLKRHGWARALAAFLAVGAGVAWMAHLWNQNQVLETRVAALGEAGSIASNSPREGVLASPLAGVPVVLLTVLRGENDISERILDEGEPYSLAIDAGSDPRLSTYSVKVLDETGKVRFERQKLVPSNLEVIQLTFPSGFFPSGDYQLRAEGFLLSGDSVDVGSYPFRVEVGGDVEGTSRNNSNRSD
ncbi:MAG: zf-HC2 domain-containing protein [Deltaproteobacteria bacterium]|nr:zf-HC2 domain-containing protein [Deltaproteobacteria bacterium]